MGQVGEEGCDEPGPFGIDLDADQTGAGLAAPLLTSPGAALVGTPGAPSLTAPVAGLVLAVALAVALAATLVPAIRAARGSTVGALADAPVRRGAGRGCSRCPGGCRCRC